MSQALLISKQRGFVVIDDMYVDGGEIPRRGIVGGQIVQMTEGRPALPTIIRIGKDFYYKDEELRPVIDEDHVAHLPPSRTTLFPQGIRQGALEFIRARAAETKPLTTTQDGERAAAEAERRTRRETPKAKARKRYKGRGRTRVASVAPGPQLGGAQVIDGGRAVRMGSTVVPTGSGLVIDGPEALEAVVGTTISKDHV